MNLHKDAINRHRVNGVMYYQIKDDTEDCDLCVMFNNKDRSEPCTQLSEHADCGPGVWVTAAYKPEFIAKLVARRLENSNDQTKND